MSNKQIIQNKFFIADTYNRDLFIALKVSYTCNPPINFFFVDIKLPLSNEEEEIKLYLKNSDPLSDDLILKYLKIFWENEPYK